jgi:hypothetical protein
MLLLIILRCSAVALTVAAVFHYDRLVRRFRAKHPLEWEAAGRPKYVSLAQARNPLFAGIAAQTWFALQTTLTKPQWARRDEELLVLWRRYVLNYLLLVAVGISLIAIELLS